MPQSIEQIIHDLKAFVPLNQTDEQDTSSYLHNITRRLLKHPERVKTTGAIFELIEKYPDEGLKSLGPLVLALEGIYGYEKFLLESLKRKPARLSVWMLKRIINVQDSKAKRDVYISLLRDCLDHPLTTKKTKSEIINFLDS